MIKVILEMELVYPYRDSLSVLLDFCALWNSSVLLGGTYMAKAQISIPSHHFKKIFHTNPSKGQYPVPSGMEGFVESVKVLKILVK